MHTYRRLFGSHGEARDGLAPLQNGIVRTTSAGVDRLQAAICLTEGCRSITVTSSITKARAARPEAGN